MPCTHLRNCWNSTHPGLKNGKVLSSQEFLELSPSQSLAREDCSEKSSLGFSAHTGPPGEMFLSAQPSKYSEAMETRVQEAWAGGRHGITHRILVLQRCRPMRAPGSWRQNARPISKEKLIQALCSKARIPAGRQLVQDARDIDRLLGKVLGGQQSQPTQQTMWATTKSDQTDTYTITYLHHLHLMSEMELQDLMYFPLVFSVALDHSFIDILSKGEERSTLYVGSV